MMLGVVGLGFFILLTLGSTVALAVRELYRACTTGVPSPVPACGACGYTVEGLTRETCPECGRSLRDVGIRTPALAASHRSSMFGAVFAWAYLHMIAIVVIAQIGVTAYFSTVAVTANQSTMNISLVPASAPYTEIDLNTSAFGAGPTAFGSLTCVLTDADGVKTTLDLSASTGTVVTASIASDLRGFVNSDPTFYATDFFEASGLDPEDPNVKQEADELKALCDWVLATPPGSWDDGSQPGMTAYTVSARSVSLASPTSMSTSDAQRNAAIVFIVVGAVLLLTFIGGTWFLVRRRRALLAPLRDLPQAA